MGKASVKMREKEKNRTQKEKKPKANCLKKFNFILKPAATRGSLRTQCVGLSLIRQGLYAAIFYSEKINNKKENEMKKKRAIFRENVCPHEDFEVVTVQEPCMKAYTRYVRRWKPNCNSEKRWCVVSEPK